MKVRRTRCWVWQWLLLAAIGVGCPRTPGPTSLSTSSSSAPSSTEPVAGGSADIPASPDASARSEVGPRDVTVPEDAMFSDGRKARGEWWYSIHVDEAKVGYRHVTVWELERPDGIWRQWRSDMELEVVRYTDVSAQQLATTATFDPAGRVRSVGYVVGKGATQRVTTGTPQADGTLLLTTQADGTTTVRRMAWSRQNQGYFAVEQSFRLQPPRSAERRTLLGAEPLNDQLVQYELRVADAPERASAEASAPDSSLPAEPIELPLWLVQGTLNPHAPEPQLVEYRIDADGNLRSTAWPGLKQRMVSVTQAEALAPNDWQARDWGRDLRVAVQPPLRRELNESQLSLNLIWPQGDPAQVFASGTGQRVTRVDGSTVRVDVYRVHARLEADHWDREPPSPADLAPTDLISCRDASIVKLARSVSGSAPRGIAEELERLVHRTVARVDFQRAFASAVEVARTRRGDCSEHSVLLAALCRAREIPARVVIGLVYAEAEEAYFYHMWNEVWVDDAWRPLDATQEPGQWGVDHIRMVATNLHEQSVYQVLTKLSRVLGELQIERATATDDTPRP